MADIPLNEEILRLFLAILVGAVIGFEREYREKAAGLRTITLVCMGAALFTMYAEYAVGRADAVRLAAGVVTGVGFLGAGVILRDHGQVLGLTTAATVWVAAALGMGLGFGAYMLIGIATLAVLAVLWLFPRLSINQRASDIQTYEVTAPYSEARHAAYLQRFTAHHARLTKRMLSKRGDDMTCLWIATGKAADLAAIAREFLEDPEVKAVNLG